MGGSSRQTFNNAGSLRRPATIASDISLAVPSFSAQSVTKAVGPREIAMNDDWDGRRPWGAPEAALLHPHDNQPGWTCPVKVERHLLRVTQFVRTARG